MNCLTFIPQKGWRPLHQEPLFWRQRSSLLTDVHSSSDDRKDTWEDESGAGEDQRQAKGPATVRSQRIGGEEEAGPVQNSFEALVQAWLLGMWPAFSFWTRKTCNKPCPSSPSALSLRLTQNYKARPVGLQVVSLLLPSVLTLNSPISLILLFLCLFSNMRTCEMR